MELFSVEFKRFVPILRDEYVNYGWPADICKNDTNSVEIEYVLSSFLIYK